LIGTGISFLGAIVAAWGGIASSRQEAALITGGDGFCYLVAYSLPSSSPIMPMIINEFELRALIPIRAAEALIKLEAREARLRGLDMPTKVAVTDPDGGIQLETIRRVMERVDRQMVDVTPEPPPLPLDHWPVQPPV
jgi:hypothetical protein